MREVVSKATTVVCVSEGSMLPWLLARAGLPSLRKVLFSRNWGIKVWCVVQCGVWGCGSRVMCGGVVPGDDVWGCVGMWSQGVMWGCGPRG